MPSSSTSHSIHRSRPCLARKAAATPRELLAALRAEVRHSAGPSASAGPGALLKPGKTSSFSVGPGGRADARAGECEEIGTGARVVQEEPGYGPDLQVLAGFDSRVKVSTRMSQRSAVSPTWRFQDIPSIGHRPSRQGTPLECAFVWRVGSQRRLGHGKVSV
jgi:hypothetical protein